MDTMAEATAVAKDKIYIFFFVLKHNIFSLHLDDLCTAHLLLTEINICIDIENKLFSFHWSLSKLNRMKALKSVVHFQWSNLELPDCSMNRRYSTTCMYMYSGPELLKAWLALTIG